MDPNQESDIAAEIRIVLLHNGQLAVTGDVDPILGFGMLEATKDVLKARATRKIQQGRIQRVAADAILRSS